MLLLSWTLALSALTGTSGAQVDSTRSAFPSNASLPYPPSLLEDHRPERFETDVQTRQQRYEASTAKKIAHVPVNVLKVPLWIINFPMEHWLVKRQLPAPVDRVVRSLGQLVETGYAIRFGGFGVGSGTGGGIGYRNLFPGTRQTYVSGFVGATFRGYQQYYLQFEQRFSDRTTVFSRSQFLDEPRIEFYGVGLHSATDDQSSYRLQTSSIDLAGQTAFGRSSFFNWQVAYKHLRTRRGLTPNIPASIDIFPADQVEGLRGSYDLLQYGVGIGLDGRDHPSYAHRGTFAQASVRLSNGFASEPRLAYTQYGFEVQQFVPLPGVRRTLAMRVRGVVTDNQSSNSRSIPVWAFEQLGGGESVRIIPNFRYADEDLLVANFEYRFPFWFLEHETGVAIDALTFFDVGTVLPELKALKQRDLRSSAGFGFRMVLRHQTLFKLDVGWTSQNFRIDAGIRGPL